MVIHLFRTSWVQNCLERYENALTYFRLSLHAVPSLGENLLLTVGEGEFLGLGNEAVSVGLSSGRHLDRY